MREHYEARVRRVLQYMHDHPSGDLSLDKLSEIACMSRFHWQRVFKSMTGESCLQATRRMRAYRAACLLVQTDETLEAVATETGYSSVRSFNRNFQHFFDETPTAFREARTLPAIASFQSATGVNAMYDITIRSQPAFRLASLAHRGNYLSIGKVFEELGAIANSRNLWPDISHMIGVYYDDPDSVTENELRSHAGMALNGNAALPQGLEEITLPAGNAAVLTFKGPYAGLADAYRHFYGQWLPESDHEPGDTPPYEIYHNSPVDTSPADLLTEVCVLLKA